MAKEKPEPAPAPKSAKEQRKDVVLKASKSIRNALMGIQEENGLSPIEAVLILSSMTADLTEIETDRQYDEYLGAD